MAEPVYRQGWVPGDIAWDKFDPSQVEPWLVDIIKTAALIEHNAPSYVDYLKRVFPDPAFHPVLEQWGREERQHGQVLGRWAALADPAFQLEEASARFQAGYRPAHFDSAEAVSVRGSQRGEMVARCVVESGTSTYYTALKEATNEPVLQEIAGRIAADEFRHYKLFYETLHNLPEPELPLWRKLQVALGRIVETDDDETAFSFYCAVVPAARTTEQPYDRRRYSHAQLRSTVRVYAGGRNFKRLVRMVAKAAGLNPQGWLVRAAAVLGWQIMQLKGGLAEPGAAARA
jgi:rubrerythrin